MMAFEGKAEHFRGILYTDSHIYKSNWHICIQNFCTRK